MRWQWAPRVTVALAAIAAITATYSRLVPVNPTTVALSYVVVVLVIATGWGLVEAAVASIAAVLSFNFFFLPPVGTWGATDPQNWVALFVLMITAFVASQLSARARRQRLEALARQRDLERLYALSRALLLADTDGAFSEVIARQIALSFDVEAVALYDAHTGETSWGGTLERPAIAVPLRQAARETAGIARVDGMAITSVRLGDSSIGSLALSDGALTDTVLHSIANVAAIGLERARTHRAAARLEAARQSGEVRAAVLDALAHEFKTPLTATRAASSELLAAQLPGEREHELAEIVDEGLDRLHALVSDAVQMLRIDAGTFAVHRQRLPLIELVERTVEAVGPRLTDHRLLNRVSPQLVIDADPDLLGLALRQLVDNAIKYSPQASTIELAARSDAVTEIDVRNSGLPIPQAERSRIFDRFYRGSQAGKVAGAGLGLSIVQQIAHAHGGAVRVDSDRDGTTFTLSLPRSAEP